MKHATILVRAIWDPEAEVFVATSDDVPGLIAEARTLSDLQRKLENLVPELIELNGTDVEGCLTEVPMIVMSEQVSKVRIRA